MTDDLVERLRSAADEMRSDYQYGWPITCDEAATRIEADAARLEKAREAALEEGAQIIIAMIEREQASDSCIQDWIEAWEMAVDNIRALKVLPIEKAKERA